MLDKIIKFFKKLFGKATGKIVIPKWDECTKSSNWTGKNAAQRMMNILSPHMDEDTFKARVRWIKIRGCNCAHVFITNKADGEKAGYSPYGNKFDFVRDKNYINVMTNRIKYLNKEGLGVILWLMADDSNAWAKAAAKNFPQYLKDIKEFGWFDYASTVCLALEANEYYSASDMNKLAAATKAVYKGKIATHHTSNRADFVGLGDLLFYQIEPTDNQTVVANACKKALSYGKPVNFFESYRCENRKNCETAFKCGCYAVGNW